MALAGWSSGRGPLYQRLADSLREAIHRGEFAAGGKLPSERELAISVGVSRTTAVAAYRLLREEGVLEARRGSGTRVAVGAALGPAVPTGVMPSLKLLGTDRAGLIDLSASVMADIDGLPADALRLTTAQLRQLAARYDYEPLGLPPLRAAIAEQFTHQGLPTRTGEVIVTTGAQQAIEVLFASLAGRHGTIVVENPTYVGALDAANAVGATVAGLRTDAQGADAGHLRDVLDRSAVELVYLMPSGQNPSGAVMGNPRRQQVCRTAAETGTPVVDDMTLAGLMSDSRPMPLAASSGATIITIGSLSKVLWAGLRVGWIRAPEAIIERLSRTKVVRDLGSSHVSQLLALQFLSAGDEIRLLRRRQLVERMDLLTALLAERLPDWTWRRPPGGPFLWVRLPRGAETFSHSAHSHGVRVLPGSKLSPDGSFGDHLRLSCVASPRHLEEAVERLRRAWHAFPALARAAGSAEAIV